MSNTNTFLLYLCRKCLSLCFYTRGSRDEVSTSRYLEERFAPYKHLFLKGRIIAECSE